MVNETQGEKTMMQMRTLRNDKGFTLVELAIVLVIIGILLGGIIKGQELIKNAKYKRLYSLYREVVAATYSYYDRYGKYPGDDNTVTARGGIWAAGANGDGNGFVDGTAGSRWCLASDATENCYAWQDLRLGGFLTGATDAVNGRLAPTHPFGANVALIRTSVGFAATWNKTFGVCFQNLPNEVAAWLDRTYDDGNIPTGTGWTSGSIRGTTDYIGGAPDAVAAITCIEG
jgi:prepilin-type N-terminal cleavage/methylation domain-containing protein